jgi:ferredoxin-NADP reductase
MPERPKPIEAAFTVDELLPHQDGYFSLRLDRTSGPAFPYAAGQFALVTVADKESGATHKKALSFSSAPQDEKTLEFTFERRGYFTQALTKLAPGDSITLRAPMGFFTLPAEKTEHFVFLSGGTGIAPILGLLRDLHGAGGAAPLLMIHSVRGPDALVFQEEFDALRAQYPHWDIRFTLTRAAEAPTAPHVRTGRISADMITAAVPDLARSLYYLCGPPLMVQDLIKILVELGVSRDRILTEQYE